MSIEVKNLTKKYGKSLALDSVSLEFEENKIYGLLGRNGAGKSTLLNIISNRIFKTSGEVILDGEDVTENKKAQSKIFLMSETNLYPASMKVSEMIRWTKKFYPETDTELALSLAKKFSLDLKKKFSSLSTGQRTIAKIIAAISSNASYTFLDEPILGLDANHRELFYKVLIESYSENPRTIVISTHLIEEIATIIEEVIIIGNGKVVMKDNTENLLQKGYTATGKTEQIEELVKDKNCIKLEKVGAVSVAFILDDKETDIPENIEISGMNLQKLFVKLTGEEGTK